MSTIDPPPIFEIIDAKPEERPQSSLGRSDHARKVEIYLNVKPWICPKCGGKMFGRCLECVFCKFVDKTHTPRPAHYTKQGGA